MMAETNSEFLKQVLAALNGRQNYQTYGQREWEILEACALVKHEDFLPRFILVPVGGLLVSIPISRVTWESIRRDASDWYEDLSNLIEYRTDGTRLNGCADAFNIPAALL
jgi:hypothetical protein